MTFWVGLFHIYREQICTFGGKLFFIRRIMKQRKSNLSPFLFSLWLHPFWRISLIRSYQTLYFMFKQEGDEVRAMCVHTWIELIHYSFEFLEVNYSGFLDAPSHLYKRLCPSVGPSVGPSVRPSVRPSVGPYVPCYFWRWKEPILGASCAVYPALLQKFPSRDD